MIPQEMVDKLLMLLEKAGVSSELSDKIKEELSKGKEVEVTKVEVKSEDEGMSDKMSPEMVDKMSPEEAKMAFKKHLEMCGKKSGEMGDKKRAVLDGLNGGY